MTIFWTGSMAIWRKKRSLWPKKKVLFHQDKSRVNTCFADMAKFNEWDYEISSQWLFSVTKLEDMIQRKKIWMKSSFKQTHIWRRMSNLIIWKSRWTGQTLYEEYERLFRKIKVFFPKKPGYTWKKISSRIWFFRIAQNVLKISFDKKNGEDLENVQFLY